MSQDAIRSVSPSIDEALTSGFRSHRVSILLIEGFALQSFASIVDILTAANGVLDGQA